MEDSRVALIQIIGMGQMAITNNWGCVKRAMTALLCLLMAHSVAVAEWSYNVDHFAVTKLDSGHNQTDFQIDHFDDNDLSPWFVDNGTAEESGGVAILKSPGSVDDDGGELSAQNSELRIGESRFDIIGSPYANGTSRWLTPTVPALNQSYEMGLSIDFSDGVFTEDKIASFSVGIINLDAPTAAILSTLMGETVPVGLSGFFTRGIEDEEFGIDTDELQIVPIVDDLGSALLMALDYDAVNNEVSARFSFDEDVEDWEPFEEYTIPQIADITLGAEWDLEATSYTVVPIPAAAWLFGSGLLGLIGFSKRKKAA